MREQKSNISNEFRYIFCAVNVTFLHFSRERYGRNDGRTDQPTDGPTDIPSYRDAMTHLKGAGMGGQFWVRAEQKLDGNRDDGELPDVGGESGSVCRPIKVMK